MNPDMAVTFPRSSCIDRGSRCPDQAFLELRSIGIPDSKRNPLVSALTGLVARTCEIKPERIFVVLADIQAPFWSLNGATIG
jgi:phenylpyruvate tautomerase PptA (4-oxalocrotonate tautomerase family)